MTGKKDMTNVPYDPQWPTAFERIRSIVAEKLGELAVAIEHVGSTAVPGLSAKPRLDIDVIVDSEGSLPEVRTLLGELGYYSQGDLGLAGREAFGRADDNVPYDGQGTEWIKQNLYVFLKDGRELRRHLVFRDYLRAHPDVAREYGELKMRLAEEYRHDQEKYVEGKDEFVARVLGFAMQLNKSGNVST